MPQTMRDRPFRLLLPVLGAALLGACTSWHMQSQPYPDASTLEAAGRMRVTTSAGRMTIDSVKLVQDTLVGRRGNEEVRVPMADVDRLELRQTDAGKTTGVALLGAAGITVIVLALSMNANFMSP